MSHIVIDDPLYYSPLGDDPDVSELVEMFVASLPQRVADLQTRFADENWTALDLAAHQLKGAAGSYGFSQLTAPLGELERLVNEQAGPTAIESALKRILAMSGRMRAGVPD